MDAWMKVSKVIQAVVNFPPNLGIHFLGRIKLFSRGQNLNIFPWTHRSISIMKTPITYPAASTTKIGPTVTMLTSIVDGSSSGSSKGSYCLRILS
jgi:hypothetical protein